LPNSQYASPTTDGSGALTGAERAELHRLLHKLLD
jgi:hypothetical protein